MKELIKNAAGRHGAVLLVTLLGIPAAILGGIFVDGIDPIISCVIVIVCLLIVLVLREFHYLSDDRLTPAQINDRTDNNLVQTRSVLSRITSADRADFTEQVKIVHHIPFAGVEWTQREAVTSVAPGGTLHWRKLTFRRYGGTDAADFRVTSARCGGRDMDFCEVAADAASCELVFAIDPPLRCPDGDPQSSIEWAVSYSRPGTWDPLRRHNQDQFTFSIPKVSPRATVELIFTGWPNAPRDLFRREPDVGDVHCDDTDEGTVVRWTIDNPTPHQTYRGWIKIK